MSTSKVFVCAESKPRLIDQTPISQVGYTPSVKPGAYVSEEQLVAKLKKLMKMNLKNFCCQDAIFFADKILHLQQSRGTDKYVKAVYDLGMFCAFI